MPAVMSAQVPSGCPVAAWAHAWHVPSQAVLQQTPATQCPVSHAPSLVQGSMLPELLEVLEVLEVELVVPVLLLLLLVALVAPVPPVSTMSMSPRSLTHPEKTKTAHVPARTLAFRLIRSSPLHQRTRAQRLATQ